MRVVIADDSTLIREGITSLLRSAGVEVVAQSADPEALVRDVALSPTVPIDRLDRHEQLVGDLAVRAPHFWFRV